MNDLQRKSDRQAASLIQHINKKNQSWSNETINYKLMEVLT